MKRIWIYAWPVLLVSACHYSDTNIPKQTPFPSPPQEASASADDLLGRAQAMFKPISKADGAMGVGITPEQVTLGKQLYLDTRLSLTGNNSCNSCHNLKTFGVDNEVTSEGDAGKRGDRNSPTSFNAALHFLQFWDGRAKDVEEQAGKPILNPVEMAIPNEQYLVDKLKKVPEYSEAFAKAYPGQPDALTYANIARAIAAFERTLITPSRFDEYLNGKEDALTADEKKGLETFIRSGCTSCHNGALLGGNAFKKFGQVNDYRPLTGSKGNDPGRMKVTGKAEDKDFFKVPSLRNIAKTHPYFHDGSVGDLGKAVKVMGKAQLNKDLSDAEVKSIVTFLHTLTADIPQH